MEAASSAGAEKLRRRRFFLAVIVLRLVTVKVRTNLVTVKGDLSRGAQQQAVEKDRGREAAKRNVRTGGSGEWREVSGSGTPTGGAVVAARTTEEVGKRKQ